MPVTCQQIANAVEQLAPRYLAEDWDNVGLLVGNSNDPVDRLIVALDVTDKVVDTCIEQGIQMIVAHHPLIFKPLKALRTDTTLGSLISKLIKHDIAVYAAHTNLDCAKAGVNDALADTLGLVDTQPLAKGHEEKLVKLAVFVPDSHVETVRQAICGAGAGHIGNYSHCTFQTGGMGTFLPLAGTNPYIGEQGNLERAGELRLETILPENLIKPVIAALLAAHPYEEVAYDLYPLYNKGGHYGLGRIGSLRHPTALSDFIDQVKFGLAVTHLKVAGPSDKIARKVAVCGGAGAGLINQALAHKADVFITGDVKYHEAQVAAENGLTIIDAGHFASERPGVIALAEYLRRWAQEGGHAVYVFADSSSSDVFTIL